MRKANTRGTGGREAHSDEADQLVVGDFERIELHLCFVKIALRSRRVCAQKAGRRKYFNAVGP
jgi:hypothetical protein